LIAVEEGKVGFAGAVVGAVAKNLGDDVGGSKEFGAIGDDFRTLGHVIGVWVTGFEAGVSLDGNFHTRFGEIGNYGGHQGNAPLPRKALTGNTNNHYVSSD
jgi:hypothetical protein